MKTLSIFLFHWGRHWGGKYGIIPDGPTDYVILFGIVAILLFIMYKLKKYKK